MKVNLTSMSKDQWKRQQQKNSTKINHVNESPKLVSIVGFMQQAQELINAIGFSFEKDFHLPVFSCKEFKRLVFFLFLAYRLYEYVFFHIHLHFSSMNNDNNKEIKYTNNKKLSSSFYLLHCKLVQHFYCKT